MVSFIQEVIDDLQLKHSNFSKITFILPSKRAGLFLRNAIAQSINQTIFAPEIHAIEEFVEVVSDFSYTTNSELLFEFYDVYLKQTPKANIESFDKFSKWAQIIIQDFNEIDRYLIEPNHVFDYLAAIKAIENQHWSQDEQQTPYIKNYLLFWNRLKHYYKALNDALKAKQKGYQGLVYREAASNIKAYNAANQDKTYVFVGFNALNSAEELIFKELLENASADIYWDVDQSFLENPIHDAGLFTRNHKAKWPYFNNHDFNWIKSHYSEEKHIEVIGAAKQIGQIKYVGELLQQLQAEDTNLKNTALILGDESLLLPLLNSIPETIDKVNVTMGLPLHLTPMSSLFEELFRIHKKSPLLYYYKDVISLLAHPFIKPLFDTLEGNLSETLITAIKTKNIANVSLEQLQKLSTSSPEVLQLLFNSWSDQPDLAISACQKIILLLKTKFDSNKSANALPLEYLYKFHTIFNELSHLNNSFEHITSIQSLYALYRELIKKETLDFRGEPLEGLQIMGMLESRVLDYETIIITSVNEGILPAGKSHNSFIPFDVKLENKLPTYKEKDAVYTYHFYRLLQRAKHVYIIYNTEADVLSGGEKSRFITQLEIEGTHKLKQSIVAPNVPAIMQQLQKIKKTPLVIEAIDSLSKKGFSPSSLTNYIRNPIDFYYDKILGITQYKDVEESIALNTLGTVIHNTLEDFYKPYIGKLITEESILSMKSNINKTVLKHFKIEYKEGDISKGKNLIIFEIAKRYVLNFLKLELSDIKQGNTIKILAVEAENKVTIYLDSIQKSVTLRGKVDRVDQYNGMTRIIDYKTGRVDPGKVEITTWDDLLTDYTKYSKSFQVLMYAYMMAKSKQIELPVQAGIISFKNLNQGFMKFATKPSSNSRTKNQLIDEETLIAFETQLKQLITEIYNPSIDFTEKKLK
ncbi:PD-(D/E)XK nuclease family protein [Subsaximicrobium wynnwilliamsii]|uniref:PD-(D/E)XK nuclease family protein n=1 Tax=Subsaximicrobium wynnwilliamsii TaxID=291179 RepID=A0A5C6ZIJ8_9FLAO|nr:PD-(D/E)XK nuclease family protein [Subsaximicrobium wynnwilliamsii]TXD83775.1 PD-(D/E)XK nuclease family protein [Subsaximicrobium wynnwilliamsii]TXD89342.1 PD-(D/E)XK nuclease family protein [Subsaximicrobium wynnwilliamsii]TXE03611.1 PD-(D/E)XK nuclease family protein [Subsaximicrobium wynnwilliamsii]